MPLRGVAARSSDAWSRVYATVRRVPRGRVATYGQIAALCGLGRGARQVGYALSALEAASNVPWHRIVDASGRVKPRATPGADDLQRVLLESEGLRFDASGRVSLAAHRWEPRSRSRAGSATTQKERRISRRSSGRSSSS